MVCVFILHFIFFQHFEHRSCVYLEVMTVSVANMSAPIVDLDEVARVK